MVSSRASKSPIIISSWDGVQLGETWDACSILPTHFSDDNSSSSSQITRDISRNCSDLNSDGEEPALSFDSHYDDSFDSLSQQAIDSFEGSVHISATHNDANKRYRNWLKTISAHRNSSDALKLRREQKIHRDRLRDKLVKRARKRKACNYLSSTFLADTNKIKRDSNAKIMTVEEREKEKEEKVKHISIIRKRSKLKYKGFLAALKVKLKIAAHAKIEEEKRKKELEQKLKSKILITRKLGREEKEEIDKKKQASCGKGLNAVRQIKDMVKNPDPRETRKSNIKALTEKYKNELEEIQRKKIKEKLAEQQTVRRLKKRALILKEKYTKALLTKINYSVESNDTCVKEELISHSGKLTEGDVDRLVQRLGKVERKKYKGLEEKVSVWRRKQGIDDDRKIFKLTGW